MNPYFSAFLSSSAGLNRFGCVFNQLANLTVLQLSLQVVPMMFLLSGLTSVTFDVFTSLTNPTPGIEISKFSLREEMEVKLTIPLLAIRTNTLPSNTGFGMNLRAMLL